MRLSRYFFVTTLLLVFASQASAFSRHYRYIEKINIDSRGFIYVNVHGNFNVDNNCRVKTWVKSRFAVDNPVAQAWLKMLLTSYAAQKPVYLVTDGCTNNYPRLVKVQVNQVKGSNPRNSAPVQCPNNRPRCCDPRPNNRCGSLRQCIPTNRRCP